MTPQETAARPGDRDRTVGGPAGSRHRFEPAPLVLGLALVGVGLAYLLDGLGEWEAPLWVVVVVVPAALVLAACTALVTLVARRRLGERAADAPPPDPR